MTELEHFSFVIPGELGAMAYPNAPGALDELRAMGVRSLVSLSRRAPPRSAVGGLVHLCCPLADFTRIPPIDLHRVVVFLDRAPSPAVIHGEGGVGRTGVALACKLVSQGRSAADAVAEVRRARPGSIDDPELLASVTDYSQFLVDILGAAPGASWESGWRERRAARSPFNFGPASSLDRIVHGAERPGYEPGWGEIASLAHDEAPTSAAPPCLDAWLGFMARQGIREVVCLLDEAEIAGFGGPLLPRYRRAFLRVTHIPVSEGSVPSIEAVEAIVDALRKAESADAPVVVHCPSGSVQTAVALAAWLRARHSLSVDAAVETVRGHARHFGAMRDPMALGNDVRRVLERVRAR